MRLALQNAGLSSRVRCRPSSQYRWHRRIQSSATDVPELVEWVERNGGKVSGVTLANLAGRDGGSGWGLKALQPCKPGARLVELPAQCQLTYDGSSDPRLLALIRQVPTELWGAQLALQVLQHRASGPASTFAAYISQLPVGIPGIPMFFRPEAVAALQYPPVSEQVKRRGRWLHGFSTKVLAPLSGTDADPFDGAQVDINALGWALAVVSSRAFRTRGPSSPAAMLPLIDMANHSFEPNCEVLPVKGGGVALVAKKQISEGEPLLLSYGPLSNDFLLMDYGFLVPGNPHDRVTLRYDVDLLQSGADMAGVKDGGEALEISRPPWKRAVLAQLELEGPGADLEVGLGGPQHVEPRLLAAARVLVAVQPSEVQGLSTEALGRWDRPLNKANETRALRTLLGVALVALGSFPTTLQQDQAALQQPGLDEDMATAVRFRLERKELLVRVIAALGERIKELPNITGLRATAPPASEKGMAPSAATAKGFGKK